MSAIKLYHGTIAKFDKVDLLHCKGEKDFGKGFYLTSDLSQAIAWAIRMQKMRGQVTPFVYSFRLEKAILNTLNVHKFQGASIAWVDYVVKNRVGNDIDDDFDVVVGKVADARAAAVVSEFIRRCGKNASDSDKKELIRALEIDNLTDQYCFKSQESISILNKFGGMLRKEIRNGRLV